MKTILFDPFSGASGDMVISALIDLGADAGKIKNAMEHTADVSVDISRTTKIGISASSVKVSAKKDTQLSFNEIIERISSANLPEAVESDAVSIFNIIGNAESKVHGVPLAQLHFHEIGQEDAIADIVGACTAFHDLDLVHHRIYCNTISVGSGFVGFSHGKFPVPTPATLEILRKYSLPWQQGPVDGELLTPTGTAILAHFVNETGNIPPMKTEATGYGAGMKDTAVPNVLRVISGEIDDALIQDRIEMLETNVDDVTGQVLGSLIEELLKSGALDVAILPATMKKGRSGHLIKVIVKPGDSGRIARKIIEETGSLGVRTIPVKHRLTAKREMNEIELEINGKTYQVAAKSARDLNGTLLNISAEFDDCKKASRDSGIPVRDVIRMAEEKARRLLF
jgi:hypothetical protein